jgi:hypothetical protein
MLVHPEALAGCDTILVDNTQAAESHVPGIVVVGETECVIGIEPSVVGVATFICGSNRNHTSTPEEFCSDKYLLDGS